MIKAELIEMIKEVDDNAELRFVSVRKDRDGWEEDYDVRVIRVEAKKA